MDAELAHLRDKMDAGADFIVTQFFYDTAVFLRYVRRCREHGIRCPILPGIMPIQSYHSFRRMTDYCGVSVPPAVLERLEPVRDDDEAVKEIGCEIATEICETILQAPEAEGGVDGVHFYTLNLERSVTRILLSMEAIDHGPPRDGGGSGSRDDAGAEGEGEPAGNVGASSAAAALIDEKGDGESAAPEGRPRSVSISKARLPPTRRQFPWRQSAMDSRSKEDVRPINWANRPKSYVMRTDDWDEFPNGRWGDSSSPAFGEISDVPHFYNFTGGSDDDRRAMLGSSPMSPGDVYELFARYVENKVPHIPWCETPLQPESYLIQSQLASLNRAGFLTINSQPPINSVPSTHPTFGWGGAGGYIYQKAYCECFASPENAEKLVAMVTENPSMNLYAVSNLGRELTVGVDEGGITALTWGVFPNREILQPTIFDPKAFLVWAEEAFSLWTSMWLNLYDFGTPSYELIETIRDTYYLVAIIDNDYIASSSSGGTGGADDGAGNGLWEALLKVGGVGVEQEQ
jgi:methylenetetrahydrofolate reductase (NADPH)